MTDLPNAPGSWSWRPAYRSALDELVNAMERRWGIDRLPRLVPADLAAKFQTATDLHAAGPTQQHTAEQLDAMMTRAWTALDAAATAAGAEPLPPGIYEIPLEGCPGAVAVICQDDDHAQAISLRAKHEGRTVSTWTLAECIRVIKANELVNRIKDRWPGAVVLPTKARGGRVPQDAIPFGAEASPAAFEEVCGDE